MKSLEIKYEKKYLLVEPEGPAYVTETDSKVFIQELYSHNSAYREGQLKFICMGDQFEKDQKITKEKGSIFGQILTVMGFDCFMKAIEKAGFYWGENPIGKEPEDIPDLGEFTVMMRKKHKSWKAAESRTFNPSKTRIYEILG
ncbi:hypothetical protein U9K52_09920 [Chryseobacterium sp. MHB01]|uniref:hypothetical protein n=1 Tax=Chryseobacterium sp. MHB01 TaxID=3109433 RepID=UPI002AFEA43A|nr:hypothetical protein [Chryseobacterium sp. MHB01]MEA1849229.1 hypothetical protein [Chryseobacterium sp. MHB01]